jgi:hypothetical protein
MKNAIAPPQGARPDPGDDQTALIARLQQQLAEQGTSLQRMAEQVQSLLHERARLQVDLATARRELMMWKGLAALGTLLGLTFGRKVR